MRKIIIRVTIILLCFHFVSCKNRAPYFKVLKNNVVWEGTSDAYVSDEGWLTIWGIKNGTQITVEDFYLDSETSFKGKGKYIINRSAYRKWQSSDILDDCETLSTNRNNILTILYYDSTKEIIAGTCSFTTVSTNNTSIFSNGTFLSKIRRPQQ